MLRAFHLLPQETNNIKEIYAVGPTPLAMVNIEKKKEDVSI